MTHHLPGAPGGPGLLPGRLRGGAEMADAEMIAKAPPGVDVTLIGPHEWEQAFNHDRVIITGTDLLTPEAMRALATLRPLVWVHHKQTPDAARKALFAAADPFVTLSDLHADAELAWCGVQSLRNMGWVDLAGCHDDAEKQRHALWAQRDHPQKGRVGARIWAREHGYPLVEITNAPRADVLAAMSVAEVFVFLPKALDGCPRTLIEAEASGCRIVTNDLAGRRRAGDLRAIVEAEPQRFWSWA